MAIGMNLFPALVMLGVSGLVYALAHLLTSDDKRVQHRLDDTARERSSSRSTRLSSRGRVAGFLEGMLPESMTRFLIGGSGRQNQLHSRLIQAGLYGNAYVLLFASAKVALALVPVLIAVVLNMMDLMEMRTALIFGAIGGGIGMLIPSFYLDRLCERRQLRLTKSLPDFLDLLITCVSSGLTLESALHRVTQELGHAHPLLAAEMARVQHEINLGATVDEALRNLAERTNLNSLRSLAGLCQQSRQFGLRISEALRVHADMLRTQREQRAEEKAQKAAVKILFPTLLLIFPSIFVVLAGPAAIQIWTNLASSHESAEVVSSK